MKTHPVFGKCELKEQNLSPEQRRFQGLSSGFERTTESGNIVVDALCEDRTLRTLLVKSFA